MEEITPAPAPLAALFEKAQQVTVTCRETRDALLETPDELVARIVSALQTLKSAILDGLEQKVMDAAERGLSAVAVYNFNGNEFVDNISILYLLKGPKPMTPKIPDTAPLPLLPSLCKSLRRLPWSTTGTGFPGETGSSSSGKQVDDIPVYKDIYSYKTL